MKESLANFIAYGFPLLLPLSLGFLFALWQLGTREFHEKCISKRFVASDFRKKDGWDKLVVDFLADEVINTFPVGIFSFAVWGITTALESHATGHSTSKCQYSGGALCLLLAILSPGFSALWTWVGSRGGRIIGNLALLVVAIVGLILIR